MNKDLLKKLKKQKFILSMFALAISETIPSMAMAAEDTQLEGGVFQEEAQGPGEIVSETRVLTEKEMAKMPTDEEVLNTVLAFHHMTMEEFQVLARECISASQVYDVYLQDVMEVARLFYFESLIPEDVKLKIALEESGMDEQQFLEYVGVVSAECTWKAETLEPNFVDAFAVASQINGNSYNPGLSAGSPYKQAFRKGYYEVVSTGAYRKKIGYHEGYRACLSLFFLEYVCKQKGYPLNEITWYEQFRAAGKKGTNRIQLVPGGNNYFNPYPRNLSLDPYVPTVSFSLEEFYDLLDEYRLLKEEENVLTLSLPESN